MTGKYILIVLKDENAIHLLQENIKKVFLLNNPKHVTALGMINAPALSVKIDSLPSNLKDFLKEMEVSE